MALNHSPVMDVSPWPNGQGFAGANIWWDYVLGKDEEQRLDHLMGVALMDEKVCKRLLQDRDDSLLEKFELSESTRRWLRTIEAKTLADFAKAILVRSAA